jgi:hypothetical protein
MGAIRALYGAGFPALQMPARTGRVPSPHEIQFWKKILKEKNRENNFYNFFSSASTRSSSFLRSVFADSRHALKSE